MVHVDVWQPKIIGAIAWESLTWCVECELCLSIYVYVCTLLQLVSNAVVVAHFWHFHSQSSLASSHLCCLCFSVSWTHFLCWITHSSYTYTSTQSSHPKSTKVAWQQHMWRNYCVHDIQTKRCRKCKATLGPAGHAFCVQPAGKYQPGLRTFRSSQVLSWKPFLVG